MFEEFQGHTDKSKLIKAWTNYYNKLGLSSRKLSEKVSMRARKNKFPIK
jgi:hypothetical protein